MVQYKITISITFLYITITMLTACSGGSSSTAGTNNGDALSGTLRVSQSNPRYFTDGSGKAIYLTGSHTWANFKDNLPSAFDYNGYLDFLQRNNHNFIRLWTWELTKSQYSGEAIGYASPFPWPRTGPGTALDGKPKFDLTQFDNSYFDRLRSRVVAARDRGIYVSIMLFEGNGMQVSLAPWRWDGHPFNIGNNINGINGDLNGDGYGIEVHTLQVPTATTIQETYVRKVIDTVNDLDNVLFEIANESGPYSTQWQYYMISYVKNYEATKPKQHPVGMTFQYSGGDNATLFSSPADWISPGYFSAEDYRSNPPPSDGRKVIILDTDHLWGIGGDHVWVWKSFVRGLNPIYMDDLGSDMMRKEVRKAMGHTLTYAKKMNLKDMLPRDDLSSTKYCLANPGSEYLVYQPASGAAFSVDLKAGDYKFEWFNPASGTIVTTGSFTAEGGTKSFTAPFSGDAVLYIYRQ